MIRKRRVASIMFKFACSDLEEALVRPEGYGR